MKKHIPTQRSTHTDRKRNSYVETIGMLDIDKERLGV